MKKLIILLCYFLLVSCSNNRDFPKDKFDQALWKSDAMGCSNQRLKLLNNFNLIKEELYELSEVEIRSVLGKPDKVELYKRKQKFYYYFIENGTQCSKTEAEEISEGRSIMVRFSALNAVNEISLKLPQ